MYDYITEEELDMMYDMIGNYGAPGGYEIDAPNDLRHIMRFWNDAKQDLFKMFGNKLIIQKEIEVNESAYSIRRKIDSERNIVDFIYHLRCNPNLHSEFYYSFIHANEMLQNNIYNGEDVILSNGKKVRKGMKMTRALKLIAEELKVEEEYEQFRLAHSRCLNTAKLKGTLCLSIHPLDYMTMSETNCGWSSCMNWSNGGDYRQGTVEMMNSPYVVVAYLTSENNIRFSSGEWNSKKWRQLFVVSPQIICSSKAYPYAHDELSEVIASWIRELAQNSGYGEYNSDYVKFTNYRDARLSTNFMYNDFSSNCVGYFGKNLTDKVDFCFSGVSECLVCGDELNPEDTVPSDLSCSSCSGTVICHECGSRVSEYYGDGMCESCYLESRTECSHCGIGYYNDEVVSVDIMYKRHYQCAEYYCRNCFKKFEHLMAKETTGWGDIRYSINLANFSEKVAAELGFNLDYVKRRYESSITELPF